MSKKQLEITRSWLVKQYSSFNLDAPTTGVAFLDALKEKISHEIRDMGAFIHRHKLNDVGRKLRVAIGNSKRTEDQMAGMKKEIAEMKREIHNLKGEVEGKAERIQVIEEESRKARLEVAAMKAALKWKNLRSATTSKEE